MVPAKILVVDDETAIRLTFQEILGQDGHEVKAAASGQEAIELIASQAFDLAVVDLFLGDASGLEILAKLRQESPDTVVIILTAYASLETAVDALRQGAHDYLLKPCQIDDLRNSIQQGLLKLRQVRQRRNLLCQLEQRISNSLATLQAVIVEQEIGVAAPDRSVNGQFLFVDDAARKQTGFVKRGRLVIDFTRHLITVDGHPLPLSTTEFNLLTYLIKSMPRIVTAQELVHQVQGYESEVWEASEIVRVHISHIRRKIKQATGHTDLIDTVRGRGYTICEI